jgi:hypothetical protein
MYYLDLYSRFGTTSAMMKPLNTILIQVLTPRLILLIAMTVTTSMTVSILRVLWIL